MKKLLVLMISLALGAVLIGGCAATTSEGDLSQAIDLTAELQSSLTTPPAAVTNAAPAADFSLRLLAEAVASGGGNPVISPISAYLALAMAADGADGVTLAQFENLLGLPRDQLNELCRSLVAALATPSGSTVLNIANSTWVDDDSVTVNTSFLQDCVDYFGAEVYTLDLPSPEALAAVNAWVNTKTNGLIPTLHEENYAENTVLLLINTVYFKALWAEPFLAEETASREFKRADGSQVTADFMNDRSCHRAYIHTDLVEGVLLPYDDGRTAFVALRPTDGSSAAEFAASLTAEQLLTYTAMAKDTLLNLSLPKFDLAFSLSLNSPLQHLGLTDAFDADLADFTPMGMGVHGNLYISEVFQKVKLIIDEAGTEAAAVTEVQMGETSAPAEPPVNLILDSPFLYAVVDLDSGVPLFIGILDDPTL
jgi:serine protease inhibitor